MVFSEIMTAVRDGACPLGVCIHEGRFTWRQQGLHLVADLGSIWERETNSPLPLGGLVARRRLGKKMLRTAAAVIRDSIEYGLSHREETLPTMRAHAREFSDDVLFQHVDLYVNSWTVDMSAIGRAALDAMYRFGKSSRQNWSQPLTVLD
jgi:1,4-dihydroxy-6-naphthoate synthase